MRTRFYGDSGDVAAKPRGQGMRPCVTFDSHVRERIVGMARLHSFALACFSRIKTDGQELHDCAHQCGSADTT